MKELIDVDRQANIFFWVKYGKTIPLSWTEEQVFIVYMAYRNND